MYHLCWQNGNSKLRIQSCKHCLGDVSRDPQSSAERLQCCQLAAALTHAVSHNICAKNVGLMRPKNAGRMYLQHFTARSATPGSLIAHLCKQTFEVSKTTQIHQDKVLEEGVDVSRIKITDF